jgi:hypothetical protein
MTEVGWLRGVDPYSCPEADKHEGGLEHSNRPMGRCKGVPSWREERESGGGFTGAVPVSDFVSHSVKKTTGICMARGGLV